MMMMKFVIVLLLSLLIALISASIDSNVNDAKAAIANEYLTIMKFYSPMCGGCQEIAPEWDEAAKVYEMMGIKTMSINIDNSDEMKFAEQLGVLEEGLPNIRIFAEQGINNGISIVKGESSVKSEELVKRVHDEVLNIATLGKSAQGLMYKRNVEL